VRWCLGEGMVAKGRAEDETGDTGAGRLVVDGGFTGAACMERAYCRIASPMGLHASYSVCR